MIIGITGGSGVGKSTVSEWFLKKGWQVLDADEIAHRIMEPPSKVLDEIRIAFGEEFIKEDGRLDRKKLGSVVFRDEEALNKLNGITHPAIVDEIKKTATDKTVVDAAVLFESGLGEICDKTIFVSCPADIRVERIAMRDGVTREYAINRINAQKSDDYYRKMCDYEIINDGNLSIEEQLEGCKF